MSDTHVYTCRDCGVATCGGVAEPERDCPVCGTRHWIRRGRLDR